MKFLITGSVRLMVVNTRRCVARQSSCRDEQHQALEFVLLLNMDTKTAYHPDPSHIRGSGCLRESKELYLLLCIQTDHVFSR